MPFDQSLENRAVRIIREAVQEAAKRMADLVLRKLAAGRKIDAAWLQSVTAELSRISDLYSSQAVNDSTADFIEQAKISARDALAKGGGEMQMLNADMINAALINTKIEIKNITDSSVSVMSQIITNAIVTGKSPEEIAKEVQERIVVSQGSIMQWRAELIARSEMMSIYRQTQFTTGEELGYEYYQYMGPKDWRTEPECKAALMIITTKEEWLKLAPLIIQYGLHYGCRHELVPVTLAKAQAYQLSIPMPDGAITITAYREAA
jgi:SPP1 gp7 family putative phage head morphogenesis protein